ncbi:MAG: glycosyltransferase family 4 protein [Candidatus Edwardsbacteria bacterium]
MKILFITPYIPYPLISGGHARIYNLIRNLSEKRHQIILLCYVRSEVKEGQIEELRHFCEEVEVLPRRPVWSVKNAFRYLFSNYPLIAVINGFDVRMENRIQEMTKRYKPDLIQVEHFHMAQPVLKQKERLNIPLVLGEQGVEFVILERFLKTTKNLLLRLALHCELSRLKRYELKVSSIFDGCMEVSEEDKRLFLKAGARNNLYVIPNGVDFKYFQTPAEVKRQTSHPPTIAFIGTFTFFGNVEAAEWLLDEILPRIESKIPEVLTYLIGNRPPSSLRKRANERVIVTGFVPDLREYLNKCDVVVVPLRTGSGTKMKILEPMAAAKAVVSTSVGIEGIEAIEGEHYFKADDACDFAAKTIFLLSNPEWQRRMGEKARELVMQKYDWKPIIERMIEVYQNILTLSSL